MGDAATQKQAPAINPLSPEFQSNPFAVYADLLTQSGRIFPMAPNVWLLPRHAEVQQWLRNDRVMIRDRDRTLARLGDGPFFDYNYNIMAMLDKPRHALVRKIVAHAFTPRALARLEALIDQTAANLLKDIVAGKPFDLFNDFAVKLPLFVICDMLGVSPDHEDLLKRVSTGLTTGSESFASPDMRAEADEVCRLMHDLLHEELAKRGPNPEGDDIISLLARHEESGDISRAEAFENATFILAAGHETTTNLIASGMRMLMENPQQMQLLRDKPESIANAVEEFLRLEPPLHFTSRVAAEDIVIADTPIAAGSVLLFGLASAGRDPEIFHNPGTLDVERANAKQHFAFTAGMHMCLGAHLARIEGAAAFRALIQCFDHYELLEPAPIKPGFIFRGLQKLVVKPI